MAREYHSDSVCKSAVMCPFSGSRKKVGEGEGEVEDGQFARNHTSHHINTVTSLAEDKTSRQLFFADKKSSAALI